MSTVVKLCFLTCLSPCLHIIFIFSTGKIHNTEIFDMLRNTDPPIIFATFRGPDEIFIYHSRALKSRSKLKATIGLIAALENFLLHKNLSLFSVTFGEKVLTLAKSRGS